MDRSSKYNPSSNVVFWSGGSDAHEGKKVNSKEVFEKQSYRELIHIIWSSEMPTSCIIVGCTNRQVKGAKNNKGFHRIPKVPASGDEETKVLAKQRRDAWIAAIRREGITTDANLDNKRVCSDHFRDGEYELLFYIWKARLIFQDSIQDFKYNSTKSDISLNSYIPSYAIGVLNCL